MVKYDVIIVGAGILGLASAYYVKSRNPNKTVLVIEKNAAAGQGSTAKSAGAFRNVFASRTNYLLADSSVDFYIHIQDELKHDLGLEKFGYLWLLSETKYKQNLYMFNSLTKRGVKLKVFEKEDLKRMIPGVCLDFESDEEAKIFGLENIDKGLLGQKCGGLDVDALVNFYEGGFKKLDGKILYNTMVSELILEPKKKLEIYGEPFVWQDKRIAGVKTDRGVCYGDSIILTPGAWANTLLDRIGIDSHIKPKKRQIFVVGGPSLWPLLNVKGFNAQNILPFTILPTHPHIYIRPYRKERSFWIGCADDIGRAFMLEDNPEAEESYYYQLYQLLRKYFPHFENVRPTNMFAGLYEMNTIDGNPYIFEEAGAIIAVGASGSGIIKADAIGRIVAALYNGEKEAELFGGRTFRVSDLSVEKRKVEKEEFIL